MRIEYEIDLETGVCSTPCPYGLVDTTLGIKECVGSCNCEKCEYCEKFVLDEENNEFYVEWNHE